MIHLALDDGSYGDWWQEHYDIGRQGLTCKRCGMNVDYLTLHARNVHEDDINVLPARGRRKHHDTEGRVIAVPAEQDD